MYLESATVTESEWKHSEWNAVNPTSEKPKLGRGIFAEEMNEAKDRTILFCRQMVIDSGEHTV